MKNSFYFPVDCAWPSDESDTIYTEAENKFETLKYEYPQRKCRFIVSNHWATQGYWIEWGESFKVSLTGSIDYLIREYNP